MPYVWFDEFRQEIKEQVCAQVYIVRTLRTAKYKRISQCDRCCRKGRDKTKEWLEDIILQWVTWNFKDVSQFKDKKMEQPASESSWQKE